MPPLCLPFYAYNTKNSLFSFCTVHFIYNFSISFFVVFVLSIFLIQNSPLLNISSLSGFFIQFIQLLSVSLLKPPIIFLYILSLFFPSSSLPFLQFFSTILSIIYHSVSLLVISFTCRFHSLSFSSIFFHSLSLLNILLFFYQPI